MEQDTAKQTVAGDENESLHVPLFFLIVRQRTPECVVGCHTENTPIPPQQMCTSESLVSGGQQLTAPVR